MAAFRAFGVINSSVFFRRSHLQINILMTLRARAPGLFLSVRSLRIPSRTVGAKHTTRGATPAAIAKGCAHSKGGSCTPLVRRRGPRSVSVFGRAEQEERPSRNDYWVMARSASTLGQRMRRQSLSHRQQSGSSRRQSATHRAGGHPLADWDLNR